MANLDLMRVIFWIYGHLIGIAIGHIPTIHHLLMRPLHPFMHFRVTKLMVSTTCSTTHLMRIGTF
jgi:hypothetical protein